MKKNCFVIYINYIINYSHLKFIYSEKATKFCEIFTLLLSYVVPVKSKVKISQNFVAFSEYMNFIAAPVALDGYASSGVRGCTGKLLVVPPFKRGDIE